MVLSVYVEGKGPAMPGSIGAKMALVSLGKCEKARAIASQTHYVELVYNLDFKQIFIETSHIGLYRIKHGKREVLD